MKEKNPHAVALGRKGGKSIFAKLTPEQRKELARAGAKARWSGQREQRKENQVQGVEESDAANQ